MDMSCGKIPKPLDILQKYFDLFNHLSVCLFALLIIEESYKLVINHFPFIPEKIQLFTYCAPPTFFFYHEYILIFE